MLLRASYVIISELKRQVGFPNVLKHMLHQFSGTKDIGTGFGEVWNLPPNFKGTGGQGQQQIF
jgi:hypothetical protein